MIRITPDPSSAFAGLDLLVDARALSRDALGAIRSALTAALPNDRSHEALRISDVAIRNDVVECYILDDLCHLQTFAFTFTACAVTAQRPNHRCPECRHFLNCDNAQTCPTCGARLSS